VGITKPSLKTKIESELIAAAGALNITVLSTTQLAKIAEAIANAVVDEFEQNAQVVGTVTSGAGAGGAITGTIT
jgi:hypothetical protein